MSRHNNDDVVEYLEVCSNHLVHANSSYMNEVFFVTSKWYGVNSSHQAVFCNLTQGQRGQPLVKEAFRKMLNSLIESKCVTLW